MRHPIPTYHAGGDLPQSTPSSSAGAAVYGPPRTVPSELEAWRLARELAADEAALSNRGLTWLLILQGLLFVAFGQCAQVAVFYDPAAIDGFFWLVCTGIALAGAGSPFFLWGSLKVAHARMRAVDAWWASLRASRPEFGGIGTPPFPGAPTLSASSTAKKLQSRHLPLLLGAIWLVLLGAVVLRWSGMVDDATIRFHEAVRAAREANETGVRPSAPADAGVAPATDDGSR